MTRLADSPQLHVVPEGTPQKHDDAEDWEAIYRREVDTTYRFIFRRTGNRADAEDLCAQMFLKALPKLRSGEDELAIRGYLYATARTLIADYWRERYSVSPFDDESEAVSQISPDPIAEDTEQHSRKVSSLLAWLPERDRAVLELRFLRGYTIAETAKALKLTVANCKVIQHRALRRAAAAEVRK